MTAPGLTPELIAFLHEQKDRADILAALHRYTRGVDRHDRALMLSAYWPDAYDEHGVAEGHAAEFVDWALGWHGQYQTRHHHGILNHTCEIDGDTAHSETYYIFWGENREGPAQISFGRYVDRHEKRGGEWRIAHRVCVNEFTADLAATPIPEAWRELMFKSGPNRRDRGDVSYVRPLTRERAPA
ncbi:MAG TPA: nuclear transport factor 2 family protein [Novosphingobium sp.]|nr:nuclear transport factor 2 family protein [Novosphingobium sp.]HZV11457.1 nuclear transport factor 2 family protein [Novosphingobium sp.]